MAQPAKGDGVAWELVGLLLVAAVFVVMILVWLVSPRDASGLASPESLTLSVAGAAPAGETEDGRPYVGPDAAAVVQVLADFQCPRSRAFAETSLVDLLRDYVATGKARLVWVSAPLLGEESRAAARAAVCAERQGRFWDMHDWLFANSSGTPDAGDFAVARLHAIAVAAGLDETAFDACLDDPATADAVSRDLAFARDHGVAVGDTPALLVGERRFTDAELDDLRALLDATATQ